jgi:glycosyltransferase involved in cell wall biosynthesis
VSFKSKKIAILASNYPPTGGGGVTSAHTNLFFLLKNLGHHAQFYTFLDGSKHFDSDPNYLSRNGLARWARNLIKALNLLFFKLISPSERAYQTSDILQSFWGAIKVRWALKKNPPDWLIIPDHCGPGLYLRRQRETKVVLISHHNPKRFIEQNLTPKFSNLDARIAVFLENQALKKVDVVVCPSDYMKRKFLETYSFSGPVYVIPNCLDLDLISGIQKSNLRQDMGLDEDSLLIYIPGAGSPLKGSTMIEEIIKNIAHNKQKKIGIYLSGPFDTKLKKELKKLNANIFFSDSIGFQENLKHVAACDFGISPSLLESFGMAILEAEFLGLPMISFEQDAIPEVLKPGVHGELAPGQDLNTLIKIANSWIQNPSTMKSKYKANLGLEFAAKHFQRCKLLWGNFLENEFKN